uniref:TBC1 domain family member 22B n=1 Tax=Salmo trutta TaxID=8032 RepID=A0A673YZD5_SALTR
MVAVGLWYGAGVSYRQQTQLHFIDGNLNAQRHRDEILRSIVVPFIRHHHLMFQHDNAQSHVSRICTQFLEAENVFLHGLHTHQTCHPLSMFGMLWIYMYNSMFQLLPISSNFTQPLKRSGRTFHRPQSTAGSTLCKGDVSRCMKQMVVTPDTEELRKHSWSGIPREVRPITWRLLSGYLPVNMERRDLVLKRKRDEYFGFIEQYYHSRTDETYKDTYRQIHIDIPRTNPLIPLFQQPAVQEVFERILFIWAIRHPASGYVQGINDLVTPFFVVFLSEFVEEDVENFDVASLPLDTQRNIEADSFWCMTKLLDGIQDNYTFAQPGIQNKVKALEELVSRIDEDIHNYFKRYEVEYLQFAFRWMNNLLMRELPLRCTIRLWDTYQAEQEGFSHFHLYVCAAFLIEWRKEILSMVDFQGLLMLLQNLPTIHWGNEEVGLLLAEAYRLKYMFADAPNHYKR